VTRATSHMTPLEAEIRRVIAVDGPIPVAQFMALALGHPVHGYYIARDPFGPRGDFITAPEISQMFGELIGLWAAAAWNEMGRPGRVRLVELGPGRGTLMADALRAVKVAQDFRAALAVDLVEISPAMRRRQQQTLGDCGVPLSWHATPAEVPEDGPLIVIANEFFDALPVHHAVRAADGWHERMIGIGDGGKLVLALSPDPIPNFSAMLPPRVGAAPVGAMFEWRSDALVTEIAGWLVRRGGTALIIDYGHAESACGETLQAVGRHSPVEVLERPGEVDLSAHVDFWALGSAAIRAGARVLGPVPQRAFLRELGIETRAAMLKTAAGARAAEIDSALSRLTEAGPRGMGELFKVVALADPKLGALPGFG
jgi:NADH dehydrogenase [ubiquinone] 1 alpha subcomplex assembly factor 7